jgi:hypothetical protein
MSVATVCIIILVTVNVGVALLVFTNRARLVFGHPVAATTKGTVVAEEKRRRGRPGKDGVKIHHLHLPLMSENEFYDVNDFFKEYSDQAGDKIVLHLATPYGVEEKVEVPYPVRWDSQVKEKLSVRLGGWV